MKSVLKLIREKYHPLWHIRRIKWLNGLLNKLDFPVCFKDKVTGFKIWIYWYRDMPYLLDTSIMESEVKDAIDLVLETCRVKSFWDVGANIGYYSWFMSNKLKGIDIVLFEPFPTNFSLLEKTISSNHFEQITLVKKAVSNETGRAVFMADDVSGATGQFESLYDDTNEMAVASAYGLTRKIEVETVKVDEFLETGIEVPDLMKIDIEEAEHLLFEGGVHLLKENKTVFIMECFNQELLEKLKRHELNLYRLDDASNYIMCPKRYIQLNEKLTKKYSRLR